MKRVLVFLFLGPVSGSMATMLFDLPTRLRLGFNPSFLGISFIFGYIAGIIPAMVLGFVDWLAANKKHRIAIVSGVAFLIGRVGVFMLFVSVAMHQLVLSVTVSPAMLGGLGAAIPAAVCSWLSSEKA
jgi:vacuolar-type H+-ATPase subunit I/STV1